MRGGWNTSILPAPNTITHNGNRSYSIVFNSTDLTSYISAGMRLRSTRTVAAPTQCTSLNGSTQYYSKSSPAGMTFTDDFTVSAWVKLSSYALGTIISRYNGTSGFMCRINADGTVEMFGTNAGAANFSTVKSLQSLPLNKWIHIAVQLDMSTFTATSTTSYVMINGLDVPAAVSRGGTNPTALIQAGSLEIGSNNGGTNPFAGKLAQVAVYSAKITQTTITASLNQTLAGTETNLVSAYSFNNVITDLNTTNANNLTANGSAVATSADSPFGGQADGTISSTLDYATVTTTAFSTNTTLTVQVLEGCTIPTSGGVSAMAYSSQEVPFGFADTKLISSKVRFRQGGSATDWSATGTTTYDTSATDTFMQAGASTAVGTTTVTFPTAFAYPPVVTIGVLNSGGTTPSWYLVNVGATSFQFVNNANVASFLWIAVGQ